MRNKAIELTDLNSVQKASLEVLCNNYPLINECPITTEENSYSQQIHSPH